MAGFEVWALIPIIALVLTVIIHFACLMAVLEDTSKYRREFGKTEFLGPFLWAMIAMLLGPIGLAIYWIMHRSTINPRNQAPTRVSTAD